MIKWCHFQLPWTTAYPDYFKRCYSTSNISETIQDRDSYNEKLTGTHALLNGVISNDVEWPWVTYRNFQRRAASRGLSATAELLVVRIHSSSTYFCVSRNRRNEHTNGFMSCSSICRHRDCTAVIIAIKTVLLHLLSALHIDAQRGCGHAPAAEAAAIMYGSGVNNHSAKTRSTDIRWADNGCIRRRTV